MRSILHTFTLGALLAYPLMAQDPTAEAILEKHLTAIGGVARLKAIETIRIQGNQILMPAPMELPMLIEQKRPNLQRVEMTVKGMTEIQTFDGREGWVKTPWAANKEAVSMRPEQIKALAETDFDSPYLDWQAKGWRAEYLGTLNQEGRALQRVQLTLSNTEWIIGTFDAKTFMEFQRERVYRELGNEIKIVNVYSDYRVVQGIRFPFYIITRAAYRGGRFKLLVDRVDVNPELFAQRFAKP